MKYTVWKSVNDSKWYWNLKGANGEKIAYGEGYSNRLDAYAAITLVKGSANAPIVEL